MALRPFKAPARIIGHRGAAGSAPENTLAAFRRAAHEGASWIETDAKLTADNAIVMFHDDLLERTTSGKGAVARATLAELRMLDAGSSFSPAFAGEKIPTLKETVGVLADLGLDCHLEIKPSPGREIETGGTVIGELARLWPSERPLPLVSSFSRASLKAARERQPEWPMGALFDDHPRDWLEWARAIGAVSIHCWHKTLTQSWARAIKDQGFLLLVYTVNDIDHARQLFGWGVDSVFTDMPGRLLEAGLG